MDYRFDWSVTRLLTPVISGRQHRNWPTARGYQKRNLSQQSARNARVSGPTLGISHSGAQGVGADEPNSIQPGVFFGKKFGDLPDGLAWLRAFAVTGAFVDELPFGSTTTTLGFNAASRKLQNTLVPTVETLNWACPFNTAPTT